ncbi:MAG TPA: hypothetical protein VIW94_01700 [Acidimicrobiia bacterium]
MSQTPGMIEDMELVMNLAAGLTAVLLAIVGIYSVASIWSDDLP